MRGSIALLFVLHVTLAAHSIHTPASQTSEELRYGFFADGTYRSKDLYPYGIEGSVGYEKHGQSGEGTLNHIGAFCDGAYGYARFGVELNRHANAPYSADALIERLYLGAGDKTWMVALGREANHVSLVRSKGWGYGFATMPLAISSFFDGSYFGDGLFGDYRVGHWHLGIDVMQDQYTDTPRATLYGAWGHDDLRLHAYVQWRERSSVRRDFSAKKHSHTHGSGCSTLIKDERCVERENLVAGLGAVGAFGSIEWLGEYLLLDAHGDAYDNRYKVRNEARLQSAYAQAIYHMGVVDLGLRSEWFWFSNRYEGSGALPIAAAMSSAYRDETQSLQTAMVSITLFEGGRVMLQSEYGRDAWAWRIGCALFWGSR